MADSMRRGNSIRGACEVAPKRWGDPVTVHVDYEAQIKVFLEECRAALVRALSERIGMEAYGIIVDVGVRGPCLEVAVQLGSTIPRKRCPPSA